MQMFLVMLCHSGDDLPVYLTDSQQDAFKVGKKLDGMPSVELCQTLKVMCCSPMCVKVVTFIDGKPVRSTVVKEFDEEEARAA